MVGEIKNHFYVDLHICTEIWLTHNNVLVLGEQYRDSVIFSDYISL